MYSCRTCQLCYYFAWFFFRFLLSVALSFRFWRFRSRTWILWYSQWLFDLAIVSLTAVSTDVGSSCFVVLRLFLLFFMSEVVRFRRQLMVSGWGRLFAGRISEGGAVLTRSSHPCTSLQCAPSLIDQSPTFVIFFSALVSVYLLCTICQIIHLTRPGLLCSASTSRADNFDWLISLIIAVQCYS